MAKNKSRFRRGLQRAWIIIKNTFKNFFKDDPISYAASIAFYTILSLPAILLIVIAIAGTLYAEETVKSDLLSQLDDLVGEKSAEGIEIMLENASRAGTSTFAKVVGILTLLFSATTAFVTLQNALNHIWGIRPKPKRGAVKYIVNRLLSLAMVATIGFLLLVSLVLDTFLVMFGRLLSSFFSDFTYYIVSILNVVISLGIITLLFALIFKVLPDAVIKWRDVWVGAAVTTLLFTLGKYLIGFYLGTSSLATSYGTAGTLVLLLVWVNYSSIILLLGAEFTASYTRELGRRIRPVEHAIMVVVQEVEVEDSVEKSAKEPKEEIEA